MAHLAKTYFTYKQLEYSGFELYDVQRRLIR